MRLVWVLVGFALVLILAAAIAGRDTVVAQESITVNLGPGRDASQPGTAVLTAQGNQTLVVINIQPGEAGVGQPAHIHLGSCPEVGSVAFPLTNVVDGTSTTTVNATLASLRDGNHSINIHKSEAEAGVYVACGNIAALPAAAPTTGGPPPVGDGGFAWWYIALAVGFLLAGGGLLAMYRWRRA